MHKDTQAAKRMLIEHVKNNYDRVGALLVRDPNWVRNFAAENGLELSPTECDYLIDILRAGYNLVTTGVECDLDGILNLEEDYDG